MQAACKRGRFEALFATPVSHSAFSYSDVNRYARLLLLAMLLALGQAGTLTHAVEHLGEAQGDAPHVACEICVGYAQLGAAAVGKISTPPALSPAPLPPALPVERFIAQRPAAAYHVRAPPVLS